MRKLMHGITVTQLCSPDGATALVADHGAHLLSWIPAGGEEALFLSTHSRYGAKDAIRGGVPIIFPQFAERGDGQRHGFARMRNWRLAFAGIEQERAVARYVLTQRDAQDSGWPHPFDLTYEVALHRQQLQLSLSVHNPSGREWEFNAALHTYLQVNDVAAVGLTGLQGLTCIDQLQAGARSVQQQACLRIDDEIDRIYLDTPDAIAVQDGCRTVLVRQSGFRDTVVWNPGSEKAAWLTDLAPDAHRSFLCVEAAAVEHVVRLAPGAHWQGTQALAISKNRTDSGR
jgi:glucose-6-phosphate 1-epimerase